MFTSFMMVIFMLIAIFSCLGWAYESHKRMTYQEMVEERETYEEQRHHAYQELAALFDVDTELDNNACMWDDGTHSEYSIMIALFRRANELQFMLDKATKQR